MLYLIIGTLTVALAAGLIFLYYLRKGQFEDIEEVKYQLFREDE